MGASAKVYTGWDDTPLSVRGEQEAEPGLQELGLQGHRSYGHGASRDYIGSL